MIEEGGPLEGYLIKISKGRWATINNRRYFALKVGGKFLVYYDKKPTEVNHIPKKVIPTDSIITVDRVETKDNKKFTITTEDIVYTLKAYNKSDREKWYNGLSKVLVNGRDEKLIVPSKHTNSVMRNNSSNRSNRSHVSENELKFKRRRSQKFTTLDPKMNLSILMKIQTDTATNFETDKVKFADPSSDFVRVYKKKFFETVISKELLYNDEHKKVTITEQNIKIFECEISKTKMKTDDIATMFGKALIIILSKFEMVLNRTFNVYLHSN